MSKKVVSKKTIKEKSSLRFEGIYENGYLIQYKIQDEKGKFFYEYELLDEPQIQETSQSIHTPKNHHVDNAPSGKSTLGKVGGYNNTNTNNTNINNTNINNISSSKEEAGEKKE